MDQEEVEAAEKRNRRTQKKHKEGTGDTREVKKKGTERSRERTKKKQLCQGKNLDSPFISCYSLSVKEKRFTIKLYT